MALTLVPDLGGSRIKNLIEHCKTAEAVCKLPKGKLMKFPGVGEKIATAVVSANQQLSLAEKHINTHQKQGIEMLAYTDERYPDRLKDIKDAPAILYHKGNTPLNRQKIISIVGTRKATRYGLEATERLVEQLQKHDCLIVSGLAYGIDIAAHKAALKNGLDTIGVMANGMDRIYPAIHKKIATQMVEQGGLLTENPLGTKPDAPLFPARNRIIAGMCDAVVVVEAAKSGGALITAEIANSYFKDVFAFPGDVNNPYSEGCNRLIRSHKANLLIDVSDLEYHLGWEKSEAKSETKKVQEINLPSLTEDERKVVTVLQEVDGLSLDELSWKSSVPANQLSGLLLNLEFQGVVSQHPGKQFRLSKALR
ncbi:MAG: DNA-processing protein DprA [Cyclobacteriaceae bacterium]